MQQRVALARALAIEPRVLLLDEPLSALDAKVRVQLREEIRRIQLELGITTLYVTHDQEEALAISDHVAVMYGGRDRADGNAGRDVHRAGDAVRRRVHRHDEPARVEGVDGSAGEVEHAGMRLAGRRGPRPSERRARAVLIRPETLELEAAGERRVAGGNALTAEVLDADIPRPGDAREGDDAGTT